MCENGIPNGGIGLPRDHRNLHGGHNLPRTNTESREAEDMIVASLYQGLEKSSHFRKCASTQVDFHRHFKQAIGNSVRFRFCFIEADVSEFRIGKQTIRNLPASRHAVAASYIGMDDTKIVDTDVGELRATRNLTDRPHARRSGLQSFVDLDVSMVRQFDSSQFQSKPLGIWGASCRYQHMTAFYHRLRPILSEHDAHRLARFPRNSIDPRIQMNVDVLVLKQVAKGFTNILVFFLH